MKKIFILKTLLYAGFLFSQSINLKLSDNKSYVYITLKLNHNIQISKDIEYANNTFYQVQKLGIKDGKVTIFLYDKNNNFIESGIANKTGNVQFESIEQTKAYWKEKEIIDKAKLDISKIKINIPKFKAVLLEFPFLVYDDTDLLFEENPCTPMNCWYEFYTLEKGKEYKMQVQLKLKEKIYKSNIVDFVY